ncbi:unnamed protein product [Bubo scandiacus]
MYWEGKLLNCCREQWLHTVSHCERLWRKVHYTKNGTNEKTIMLFHHLLLSPHGYEGEKKQKKKALNFLKHRVQQLTAHVVSLTLCFLISLTHMDKKILSPNRGRTNVPCDLVHIKYGKMEYC